jgi:CubicO group peptidase (beta-lactamase class C family)
MPRSRLPDVVRRIVLGSGLLLAAAAASAQTETPRQAPAEATRALLAPFSGPDRPALAVLVAQGEDVRFRQVSGLADVAGGRAALPDTGFRIGSVTKQFTATAILLLAQDGKLDLEDPLARHLPDAPHGDEITIRQLLHHTSGLANHTDLPGFLERVPRPATPAEVIATFRELPLAFPPGTRFAYCNSGYFLLGEVVARVSGQPFADFLRDRIFLPAGMTRTYPHRPGTGEERDSLGHAVHPDTGEITRALDWHMSWAGGAGDLVSTVDDLHRWHLALFGGHLLRPEFLRLAHRPHVPGDDGAEADEGYGFGWTIRPFRGTTLLSHGGGLHGFQSFLAYVPEHRCTVVVLTNASPAERGLDRVALTERILGIFLGDRLAPREPVTASVALDEAALDAYVGRYDYGGPVLQVTREGTRLRARLTGQDALEIVPRGDDRFAWTAVDARVRFLRDETGKVTGAIHSQGGTTIHASRLPDRPGPVAVPPETLRRCVGRYDYGSGGILTVALDPDGKRLRARLPGQPELTLVPRSETVFVWEDVEAEIEFLPAPDGSTVTGAIHRQGGQILQVRKLPGDPEP